MPEGGGDAIGNLKVERGVCVSVYKVYFGIVVWMSRGGVNVEADPKLELVYCSGERDGTLPSKIAAPFKIKIRTGVNKVLLVSEDDKTSTGNLDARISTNNSGWPRCLLPPKQADREHPSRECGG